MASPDHSRIRELFHQAVDLPPAARTGFLANSCGQDTELRSAVERLLRNHFPETPLLESEQQNSEVLPAAPLKPAFGSGTQRFGNTVAEDLSQSALGQLQRRTHSLSSFYNDRWPLAAVGIVATTLLVGIGFWCYSAIRTATSTTVERGMAGLLDQQVYAIESWLQAEERAVQSWVRAPEIVTAVTELDQIARSESSPQDALASSTGSTNLAAALSRRNVDNVDYDFAVWNREGMLIADSSPENAEFLGNGPTEYGASLMSRVFGGETVVWMPSRAGFITKDFVLPEKIAQPGLALITPIRNAEDRAIAAILLFNVRLQERFQQLLKKGWLGETGQIYVVGEDGYLMSESRFTTQLQDIGLLDVVSDAVSAQAVRSSDPGGNLRQNYQPTLQPAEWPLTRAAASVVAGLDGSDISGYRDFRGVPVIGVWSWLRKYRFGVIAEVEYDYAFRPLAPLVTAFVVLLTAFGVAAITAVITAVAFFRLRQHGHVGTRVGPYTLKSLIGEGGFARVYLATHALLKRPTAVKILKPDQINKKNLVRFEREVQLASSLTHPNTIGIYDYGATQDGGFYYAMEFIKGLSLQELVDADGPQRPERVVWILNQVCRSLREAHDKGLVHRDIKPQNIMLCHYAGEHDTVKVLDFGLARNLVSCDSNRVTETQLLIGTPLYIAPERIIDPTCMDPRSDIYSLGILGYYLLTGREPFDATDSIDALAQTMNRTARRPSEQSPHSISESLDALIRDCHSRAITERPATIELLLQRMETVVLTTSWNADRAADWWDQHQEKVADAIARVAAGSALTAELPARR